MPTLESTMERNNITPYGTSFYVWAKIHHEMPDMPFLIDTGAGVSLLPERLYYKIPEEDRPPLFYSSIRIFCGNSNPIRVTGVVALTVRIQNVDYSAIFHVSADEVKGILGTDFLERYDAKVQLKRRCLQLNNKCINIYSQQGLQLNHRVVLDSDIDVPPGGRCVLDGRVVGRRNIRGMPVMVEAAKSLFPKTGVLVARIVVQPDDENHVPVEVHNVTDTKQRLYKHQVIGEIDSIVDAELWETPPQRHEEIVKPHIEVHANDFGFSNNSSTRVHDDYWYDRNENLENNDNEGVYDAHDALEGYDYPEEVAVTIPKMYTEEDEMSFFPPEPTCTWTCEKVCEKLDEPSAELQQSSRLPEHVRETFEKHATDMQNPWDRVSFHLLLDEFHDIFAKDKYDLGKTTLAKHHIETGNEPPVKQKPRRLPQAQHEEIQKQVLKLRDSGIIRPSNSNYASNVLLVKKKDGSWRMCVDYRELNAKTKHKDPYLIPRIDDTLDALGGAKYFCTLDLLQGYHQVELTESSKGKTAFLTPHMSPNLWEYTCMPFGITGGPATFQRVMDRLLSGMEYKIALAYLDDIIVFGSSRAQVMNRLAQVFNRLRWAQLKLKASKCTFFENETLYLGHLVSSEGVKCDPAKIQAVKDWKRPTTSKQAHSFVAFVNYYNRFIKDFFQIAKPLYELTKKRKKFEWNEEHENAFQTLRKAVISAPVMAYPAKEGDWILDTDASGFAIGGVLSQMQKNDNDEWEEKVIAYGSKSLQGRQQRYCTRRRELLAIVHFVSVFRAYLYGRKVTIRTDHASLKYIKTLNNPDDQFARWIERLEEMFYTIEIRQGTQHSNADALSRLPSANCEGKRCICPGVAELENKELEETGTIKDDYMTLSNFDKVMIDAVSCDISPEIAPNESVETVQVNAFKFTQHWTAEEIANEQQQDKDLKLLYRTKANGEQKPSPNQLSALSGAAKVYFHDWQRVMIKSNNIMHRVCESVDGTEVRHQMLLPFKYREMLFHHLHKALDAGHMGRRRTLHRLQRKYYWHRMGEDIRLWIRACQTCQKRKRPGKMPKAPMQIYLSGEPNERIAMDVMGPLVKSKRGNKYILVIIDHFTKYARAAALPNQKKETLASALLNEWISIFGAPQQLHTDRGTNMESGMMHELCDMLKIDKTKTSVAHPQGDGCCERQNQTLINLVHTYAADEPKEWDKYLNVVMLGYNSTVHASTGIEPNRLMLGKNVCMPVDIMMPADPDVEVQPVDEYIQVLDKRIRKVYEAARENLGRAATAMKKYHDKNTHLNHYKPGDAVWMKNTQRTPGQKFEDKYIGPFFVLKAVGLATFRIAMSEKSREKVVHHDLLVPCHSENLPLESEKGWIYERAKEYRYRAGQIADQIVQTDQAEAGDTQVNQEERNSNPDNAEIRVPGDRSRQQTTELDENLSRAFQGLTLQNEGNENRETGVQRGRKTKVSKRKRTKYRKIDTSMCQPCSVPLERVRVPKRSSNPALHKNVRRDLPFAPKKTVKITAPPTLAKIVKPDLRKKLPLVHAESRTLDQSPSDKVKILPPQCTPPRQTKECKTLAKSYENVAPTAPKPQRVKTRVRVRTAPVRTQRSCENVKPKTSSIDVHQPQVNCRSRERDTRDQDPPDGLGRALSHEAQTRARQERQTMQEFAVNAFYRVVNGIFNPMNRLYRA